ncbi:endonuclease/exonuclease/phosphatase family protein [Pseudoprevotella muciniphila]|nr:endonuclease/exonuclease/phosphatase family protein [Pseudoprevotella muciniphila]
MDVRKILKVMRWVATFVAILSVFLLTLCSLSVYINPERCQYVSVFCLLFPLWLVMSLTMTVVVLFYNRKLALVLFAVLCCNIPSIRNYCPLNLPVSAEEVKGQTLKVMSYNVQGFGLAAKGEKSLHAFRAFLDTCDADIVSFQEGSFKKVVDTCLIAPARRNYPYFMKNKGVYWHSWVGVFSKYPILSYETIDTTGNNICCAFKVELPKGDTLIVVNAHMPSLRLSAEERLLLKDVIDVAHKETNNAGFPSLIASVCAAGKLRARQVDNICNYLKLHQGENIILTGDFNDTPVSYAHQRISDYLQDCFKAVGNGIGRTFNKDALYVRIDNVFSSEWWKPVACEIRDDVHLSDHYPIVCTLKRTE